mmetsp:Transcript_3350/g.5115  ORF Transcript_3350/g.5115 Transcript_3350/m.5115 type:complete len:329 (+) Transcript_3350:245-1231(+)|eukprot:CAMPEP_0178926348 /NCGR_PEP_ID=MMETSP0786-20121207/18480_1 /TAXON_ID=186022 /ORGANISM="Thalassionema frauenfeldii, Strain CCMP 1798" /LENGTH=328 /DNA_ID=CAMNT_0020601455 /DNA_START=169 /DNA_END=1155 /DNA_ORIENTATION=+
MEIATMEIETAPVGDEQDQPIPVIVTQQQQDAYYQEEEEEPCFCGNPFGDSNKKMGAVIVYDPTPQDDDDDDDLENSLKHKNIFTQWFHKIIKRNDPTMSHKRHLSSLSKQTSLPLLQNDEDDDDDDDKITDDEDSSTGVILRVPDASSCPVLLTPELFLELTQALPWTLRHSTWERCFCIARDGDSIQHMLRLCQPYAQTLLVLQTTQGRVLGAFCTGRWQLPQRSKPSHYYGNGQSFLFRVVSFQDDVEIYKWTGTNHYCQLCCSKSGRIAMGGGNGDFGLVLEDNFSVGHSGPCATYGNPPLAGEPYFEIAALELYGPKNPYLYS